MANSTVYLHDYKPTSFVPITVHLNFELFDDEVLLTNQMLIQRRHPGALCLYGQDLELVSLQLNSNLLTPQTYRLEGQNLLLEDCPDEFLLTIVTRLKPQDNTQLSGLYRSKNLFCTQCEPEGFRRMTYFFDRPDVLATYTTEISAPRSEYPVLLSNGNLIDSGTKPNGRHWVTWHDPFKKPSYLFALVAGQLEYLQDEFITQSGKRIELRIYVEPGYIDQCTHAMNSLKKAMRWDEEEFGREYDLSIFMIVAISDFNMGAMENKGLNLFNARYILASPSSATDADYANIESVVAHEYFHNWTGNRVTCRDWFQLSLKEGLTVFRDQEFSRDMNSRDVDRIMDVKILCNTQFPEDAGLLAHPVQPASYQEISNFYTATVYNKGAEVIRMQQTLLGKAGFRRGMDLYFERHDGQAVTIDDFVSAMEDANGVSLSQFKRWYHQAGTPEVTVESTFKQNQLSLSFKQTCRSTPECKQKKPFHIPIKIALFNQAGQPLPLKTDLIELTKATETFHFNDLPEEPVISLLRDFSAPIRLDFNLSEKASLTLLRHETDGFSKWQAAQNLANSALLDFYQHSKKALSTSLIDAYRHVLLDLELDPSLRAELLIPPSFEELVNLIKEADVTRIEDSRDRFKVELGQALYQDAHAVYQSLWQKEDHKMHGEAYGRRKLRQVCLQLMMHGDEARTLDLCHHQFTKAKTMTDQSGSLFLLASCQDEALREKVLGQFYRQWKQDALVIDKWFTVQASADLPDVLERVQSLLSHPDFTLKNPNRARSLIIAFCQLNPRYFHAIDGRGYAFLRDMMIQIDKMNAQLSARLALPFTRWQMLDKKRQALMKKELKALHQMTLSKELSEVISKSLEAI